MNQRFLQQWKELQREAEDEKYRNIQSMFENDESRVQDLSFEVADISVDFSKNWLNLDILNQLFNLSRSAQIEEKIKALFAGENVNVTENKAATHTIQRKQYSSKNIMDDRQKMFEVAKNYQTGHWSARF